MDNEELKSFFRSLATGGVSATIAKTVVAPLERVITMVKVHNEPLESREFFSIVRNLWTSQPQNLSPFVKSFTYYRGNFTNILRYFPLQSFNFAFRGLYKSVFFPNTDGFSKKKMAFVHFTAGGLAGASSMTLLYPLEVVRTLFSADLGTSRKGGILDCVRRNVKIGGIRSLYRGYLLTMCMFVPYRALYFGLYDLGKEILLKKNKGKKKNQSKITSFVKRFMISHTTTIFAQTLGYPFDTVRRRLQYDVEGRYGGFGDCARGIMRKEGFGAFFRGAWINVFRATGASLCLVFYDAIFQFLFPGHDVK